MDDRRNMGAKIQRKRPRRRSRTRKIPIDSFINMAEVRREIVNALQLHRSSTSTPSTDHINMSNKAAVMSSHHHYYPSSDHQPSVAAPEPIWSTTAPAVLAVPPAAAGEVLIEFEWPESLSSSYTWWSSFLDSLDGKTSKEINMQVENSRVYEQSSSSCPDDANLEVPVLEANDPQNPCPDEWLIVPAAAAEDSSDLL